MPIHARVAVLRPGRRNLEIEEVQLPAPGPHQVIVEQTAAGVCHSQLHQIDGAERRRTLVLGHESVGVVVAAGDAVRSVSVGQPGLVTWMPRRSADDSLVEPSAVLLPDGDTAVTHNIFTWATHTLVDERYVVATPSGAPDRVSAVIGCAVMTGAGAVLNTARVSAGDSVVVWGVGGVGLSAVAAASDLGAAPVVAVDLSEDKLRLARRFGADAVFMANEPGVTEAIRNVTKSSRGDGADVAFDCIGRPQTVRQCLESVRRGRLGQLRGGTVVLVGALQGSMDIDGLDLMTGQKSLVGSLGGDCVPERDFERFVSMHARGRLDLTALVTDRYGLDDINEAVDDLRAGRIAGRAVLEF